jgi:polyferredoxin
MTDGTQTISGEKLNAERWTAEARGAEEERRTIHRPMIKILPPEMRKEKPSYVREPLWYKRIILRLQEDVQLFRTSVQAAFALLCVWIGVEFWMFVRWGESGGTTSYVSRPPGAEGFLPISALISLKYFLLTGVINTIHPSSMFIFIGVLLISFFLKKAFCSWLCPVGTLSESLWRLGQKLFRRNFQIPRWADYPLRAIKYLLLLFFVYIVWEMSEEGLRLFIESPYNKVADVKMFYFFAHISTFALSTIIVLMLLSVVVKNFWCRFLCPYGALLGITGFFSPVKVTRNAASCIDCSLCTKACPANLQVHRLSRISSDECTNCLECVAVCPVKNTLELRMPDRKTVVPNWVFGLLIVGVFIGITGLAMITGHWRNSIPREEYLGHFQQINSSLYEHERAIR